MKRVLDAALAAYHCKVICDKCGHEYLSTEGMTPDDAEGRFVTQFGNIEKCTQGDCSGEISLHYSQSSNNLYTPSNPYSEKDIEINQ